MPTVSASRLAPTRLPTVARLGFDYGWLRLDPTFLNFGRAGLLIDYRLFHGDPYALGFENFGSREPKVGLPITTIRADLRSRYGIELQVPDRGREVGCLAARSFDQEHGPNWMRRAHGDRSLLVLVGDTYQIQLGWPALWHCAIGVAFACCPTQSSSSHYRTIVGRPSRLESDLADAPRLNP